MTDDKFECKKDNADGSICCDFRYWFSVFLSGSWFQMLSRPASDEYYGGGVSGTGVCTGGSIPLQPDPKHAGAWDGFGFSRQHVRGTFGRDFVPDGKETAFAYAGEVFGTSVIGGMLAYPMAKLVLGNDQAAIFTFVVPFLISTCGGTILAIFLVGAMKKSGIIDRLLDSV